MTPIIDHINITVKDIKNAETFYDQLMPILGFDINKKSKGRVEANDFDVIEYVHENLTFAINSPRNQFKNDEVHRRKPGALHHIAFRANTEEEINNLYQQIKETKANIISKPKLYPQHGQHYYALFFKDPDGIKYELVFDKK